MHSNKIRLLHLIKSLDMGGIEKSTILYSNHLQEKLDFIGIYASEGFYDHTDFINSKIKRFFPQHPVWQKKYFIHSLVDILSILKEYKISHIHYHHRIFIPYIFFVRLFLPKIKVIYTHHSVFNDSINKMIICNKIIALNKTTKLDLPQYLRKRSSIIPHGVKVKYKVYEKSNSPRNIGYVGRFVKEKCLLNLIIKFKVINEQVPDTNLIFIGEGPLKNEMIKEIIKQGISQKVKFKNKEFNNYEIYSEIDILVLLSKNLEGFGLVVLEAMALGIPVITSRLSIFNELIENRFNGILTDNNLFEANILELLNNNILLNKLRNNGLETAKKFDVNNTIEKYLKVYKNLN